MKTQINNEALFNIVKYAYNSCEFYKVFYDQFNVDINNINDITDLPIINSKEISKNPFGFRSINAKCHRITGSSGTYGEPKFFFRTEDDFRNSVETEIRLMKMAGVKQDGETIAIIHPFGLWGIGSLYLEAVKKLGNTALPIDSLGDETIYHTLKKFNVSTVCTTPSQLLRITNIAFADKPTNKLFFQRIILTGEPISNNLLTFFRKFWESKIFIHYGSEETDGIGGTCGEDCGIHIFTDKFVIEVLDENNFPVKIGEQGKLVITSLYHQGTPIIRYNLGDIIRYVPINERKCEFNYPIIEILGKDEEIFWLYHGVKLTESQIESSLSILNDNLLTFQAICTIDESTNIVVVNINIISNANISFSITNNLIERLNKSSLDVESLIEQSILKFKITQNKILIKTMRGKVKRLIDKRKDITSISL